jgi:phage terminase large subunit-like protein
MDRVKDGGRKKEILNSSFMNKHINVNETATAGNNSRIMEAETISKNGVSLKNFMSRGKSIFVC